VRGNSIVGRLDYTIARVKGKHDMMERELLSRKPTTRKTFLVEDDNAEDVSSHRY